MSGEAGEAHRALFDVLDCDSEWANSYGDLTLDEHEELIGLNHWLLIADRVELVPDARGHNLGLHVLARALRTWASDDGTVVMLTAGSVEHDLDQPVERRKAYHKLARHWSKLGFEPFGESGEAPVLYACSEWSRFDEALRRHCTWASPAAAQSA